MDKNRLAVITGGSRGIGYAIAHGLAVEGYDLVLMSRSAANLIKARTTLSEQFPGITVSIEQVDMGDKQALRASADRILAASDHVDVLVNNAGAFIPGSVLTEPDGTLEEMMSINVYSAYYLTRYLFDAVKACDGYIFNMCSIASITEYPNGGAYGISKFAMLGWSKNLREECKTTGVRVSAVLPGATWTDSWKESGLPQERFVRSEDIAAQVVTAVKMSPGAVVEEIVIRPQVGDV